MIYTYRIAITEHNVSITYMALYNNIIKEKEPHRNSIDLESKAPPKDTDEHRPNTPPPKNSIYADLRERR